MDTINTLADASEYFIGQMKDNKKSENYNYYAVAGIVISWALLEAYILQTAKVQSTTKNLHLHERAFLLEKELKINDNGLFKEHRSRPPSLKKALFLINLFSKRTPSDIKKLKVWNEIKQCERIRNELIHPKKEEINRMTIKQVQFFRQTVISFVKYLHKTIFHKRINLH